MSRFIRNISIHASVIAALASFAVLIGVVALLSFLSDRQAGRIMTDLDRINVQQLNEINRADALLNHARVSLEIASNQIMLGRMQDANRQLEMAEDRMDRAEVRLSNFIAAPKSSEAQQIAVQLEHYFATVLDLVRRQHTALDELDTPGFGNLRDELIEPSAALADSMTEFVAYGFDNAQTMTADFHSQAERFGWIILGAVALAAIALLLVYIGLRATVIRPLNSAVQHLQTIAKADLTARIPEGSRNEIGKLFNAMRNMQQSLTRIVGQVRDSSGSIHIGTREIASGNTDLSTRTEQQAASLQETAASMEELTATVRQNADNARQASGLALEASTTAERGGEVVDRVVSTMGAISTSSQKISDITSVIDSIAFQTNILALNASVEAARAGEQGRGFAVVAGEVRNLASRSATAAKEIKELIDSSVAQVKDGSTLAEQAGETMDEVVKAVRRVTDIMDEISAASQEQSDGIEQVSQAVGQMDQVTQQNASLVQQATAAAASLEEQASRLEQAAAVFRLAGDAQREPGNAEHSQQHAQQASAPNGGQPAPVPALAGGAGQARPAASVPVQVDPKPKRKPQTESVSEGDWEEF
ncbi:methyl-accepting chemotaxis protein [Billgrantia kenyensis]|uniref:HAMP domain-containing protein n=1 Tax=Billgrantia kenyensis TaxID=321266 RepID=A0A7V9W0N5_9GAMM|nr:methyl-accepting chemotaxis protein [Halomonas kenyensis]MBA2778880.1 Tar ligand binding domain-containing protein [Halomonas kenyensis]MCG6662807.1 HAMP domain-containing protein [Halomonas kenyensis]